MNYEEIPEDRCSGDVYLLWNWLMPELFHLPVVTFWQALGITTLANILFKSNSNGKSEK